jgi:plastocyanin domain-containing protein
MGFPDVERRSDRDRVGELVLLHGAKSLRNREMPATARQEVSITREGRYSLSMARVKKGQPLRLIFNRKEQPPCSDEVLMSE